MVTVDVLRRMVYKDGQEIKIRSPRIMNMLIYLIESNGMVRSKSDIIESCWGDNKYITLRNIDVQISLLRKMLGDRRNLQNQPIASDQIIITVFKIGYKINPRNIRNINQKLTEEKQETLEGYVFLQYARYQGEVMAVLQNIVDTDDWIIVPKAEYVKQKMRYKNVLSEK